MRFYLAQRFVWSAIVVVGVTIVTFVLTNVVPTNPAQMLAGPEASTETVTRIHHELGLDRPLLEQYGRRLWSLLRGDFGASWRSQQPVAELLTQRVGASCLLATTGLLFELAIGLPIGLVSALRQNSVIDRVLMGTSFLCLAAPPFWLGLLLLYVLGFLFPLFPLGGYGTGWHLFLPAMTIGVAYSPWYARLFRSSLLDILGADFIRTARAKGLPERRVVLRHAVQNALRPVVTLLGADLAQFLGGIIVVEQVFGWPGLGKLTLDAILNLDLPVIMAVVFLSGVTVALINLVVDLTYAFLDPRVTYR